MTLLVKWILAIKNLQKCMGLICPVQNVAEVSVWVPDPLASIEEHLL